jgi:Tachylectin
MDEFAERRLYWFADEFAALRRGGALMALRLLTFGNQVHWERPDPQFAEGITLPGFHYGVGDDGLLRWYRFLGTKIEDPTNPGFPAWDHNSGNVIGTGWAAAKWMQLGDNGTLAVIKEDGGLYLYRYDGHGEEDTTGTRGWLVGSGTEINTGWDQFLHVAIGTDESREVGLNDISLMAVDSVGDMYWFKFAEVNGVYGLQSGSGRVVGSGWAECEHIATAGNLVFAVMPSGELRWFAFDYSDGDFVEWRENSGNVIGTGWAGLRHVDACYIGIGDGPDFTPIMDLTTVDSSGGVRWFRYSGTGVADPAGQLGWDLDSGTSIRTGW